MDERRPPQTDEERRRANIVLLVVFVVVVGVGVWLVNAMLDARKADECMTQHRRNCNPIDVPPRSPAP